MTPEIAEILAMADALVFGSGIYNGHIHIPQSDWRHSDERQRKAEEKRKRKQQKRAKEFKK